MKTIIAAFGDEAATQQARTFLSAHDVENMQFLDQRTAGAELIDKLESAKVPRDKAERYAELSRRGCSLLMAEAPDDRAQDLAEELDRMGSLDLDAAEQRWRAGGWSGFDANATPYDTEASDAERRDLRRESFLDQESAGGDLELVEEQVRIGKREVPRGGVRVRTYIIERPVRQDVQLREERIDVHREQVNEPISSAAADAALTEEEIVVTATGEEAVIGKEARVVERVHVGKSAETRTETIEDTERRQEVEVEPVGQQPAEPRPRH